MSLDKEEYIERLIRDRRGSKDVDDGIELSDKITSTPRGNHECMGEKWDMVLGETYAFRTWNRDDKGRLVSPSQHFVWKPGKNTAFDREHYTEKGGYGRRHHDTPHGFFAYTDEPTFPAINAVKGVIKAWGWVTEGTRGITAEHAEIVALVDPTISKTEGHKSFLGARKQAERLHADAKKMRPEVLARFIFVATMAMFVLGVASGALMLWAFLAFFGVLFVLGIVGLAWNVRVDNILDDLIRDDKKNKKNPTGQYPLSVLYPDAELFATEKEMLDKYRPMIVSIKPPPPPEPTPEDEEFWL